MTAFLNANHIRIFDYPRWAEPLRHEIRQHAEALDRDNGLEIDFIRKNGCTEWLSWVSSDNVHHPNWASKLLAKTAPDVGVVYSGFNRVTMDDGCKHEYRFRPWAAGALMRPPCFIGPSFIVRAEVWQPHRGKCSHDLDNWLRVEEECLARALRIVGLDEPLCFYRVHKKMATLNKMPGAHDAAHWRKEAARRRSHHQHSRRRR